MTSASKRLCVIPARGGSKRLPRKNALPFLGKPMVGWSIDCAKASGLFERVYVSSEDAEIGAIAQTYGAVWEQRSAVFAHDRATVAEVCLDFLDREEAAGRQYDTLAVLYATAPMCEPADMRAVVDLVENRGANFAMTVTQFSHDPYGALIVQEDGTAEVWQLEMKLKKRQDRPELKVDAGIAYAVRVTAFRETRGFYGPNLKVIEIPADRAVDINTAEDFDRAEYYARRRTAGAMGT